MNNEEAIEDLLRHHTGESTDMAIKALGKDIPKAPKKGDIPRYGMGYEYCIFNFIHILKCFDWENDYLIAIGG